MKEYNYREGPTPSFSCQSLLFRVFSLRLRAGKGDVMNKQMECMCQHCGISIHLPAELISLEDPANTEMKLLSSINVCESCGGQLALVGKAGDEPHYRTD